MGLIFSVIAAVSCGPELERRPGSGLSAVCLFVLCGFAALFVGTRVCDDRYAAGVASSGARLGWLAAVAARRPHMQFNVRLRARGLRALVLVSVHLPLSPHLPPHAVLPGVRYQFARMGGCAAQCGPRRTGGRRRRRHDCRPGERSRAGRHLRLQIGTPGRVGELTRASVAAPEDIMFNCIHIFITSRTI
ncbi:hypothetical protein T492DRAFT_984889 [Pavlovales sp. CCMP2436]|nr:hypothetical protein T492DRAFT_984889 [Pavlovales sp. CCMP2436]